MLRTCSAGVSIAVGALLTTAIAAHAQPQILEDQSLAGGPSADAFGQALAVDGERAVVVSWVEGVLYLFAFDSTAGTWSADGSIIPTGFEFLAPTVAIAGDTVFYAAVIDSGGGDASGWTFDVRARTLGPNSTETVVLTSTNSYPVLAASGTTLVVGHPRVDAAGSVAIYENEGGNWQLRRFLLGTGIGSDLGAAVDTDGFWAALGDPTASPEGTVQLLIRSNQGEWNDYQTLQFSTAHSGSVRFGTAVAVEGVCLAVGMPLYESGPIPSPPIDHGGVAVYGVSNFFWTLRQTLFPTLGTNDRWGQALDLAGPNLIVGGPEVLRPGGMPQGDVALYRRSGRVCNNGIWRDHARLRATGLVVDPATSADYGIAVAADSASGFLVGDPLRSSSTYEGRVRAFSPAHLLLFGDGFENGNTDSWSSTTR